MGPVVGTSVSGEMYVDWPDSSVTLLTFSTKLETGYKTSGP